MVKELEKVRKNFIKVWKWSGAMENYLQAAKEHLNNIKKNPEDKSAKGEFRAAKKSLWYASRAEMRGVNRFYKRIKKALEDLEKILPSNLKQKLEKIQKTFLRPNEAVLIRETSFYVGKLNDDLKRLGAQLDLHEKKKGDRRNTVALADKIISDIEETRGSATKPGLIGFVAALKHLQAFIQELEKMSA